MARPGASAGLIKSAAAPQERASHDVADDVEVDAAFASSGRDQDRGDRLALRHLGLLRISWSVSFWRSVPSSLRNWCVMPGWYASGRQRIEDPSYLRPSVRFRGLDHWHRPQDPAKHHANALRLHHHQGDLINNCV